MPPRLVLDTNVVLGWMVFHDPPSMAIGAAIESGAALWLGAESVRAELAHVVHRGIKHWPCRPQAILSCFDMHSVQEPEDRLVAHSLVCTDTSDQKFIDLAVASDANVLISRDRAVLRLAKRAREINLLIVAPEQFAL